MRKSSTAIGQKAAQTLYYSFEQARRIGTPLNTHATINYASTHCPPDEAVAAFSRLRRNFMTKWAARLPEGEAFTPTGAYAFQNTRDDVVFETMNPDDDHNVHVHWALHIPPRLRALFEGVLYEWIDATSNGVRDPATVLKITHPPELTLRSYLIRGTVAQWAGIYGATVEPKGLIVGGRRSGTTLNIGKGARKEMDRALNIRRRIPARPNKRRQDNEAHI